MQALLADQDRYQGLSRAQKIDILHILEEHERRHARRQILSLFPDEGPLRRELYPRHLEFFALGTQFRQRLFMAANRVGKTVVGLFEVVCHATGRYPPWWAGRRYTNAAPLIWMAGDTGKTVRDILQAKLLGKPGEHGTGLLFGDCLVTTTPKQGVPEAVETVYVQHVPTGTFSRIVFKSYDQRREAFQGNEPDIILLDEEPPSEIYEECLVRTMTNDGMVMLTFTPLQGLTEVVLQFFPDGDIEATKNATTGRATVMASWDDVPHLSDAVKAELLANMLPYQRDARSKGRPSLGAGAIYPVPEDDIKEAPFPLPDHWPRAYGFDVGWKKTAAAFGAWDQESETWHIYSEHYRGEAEPVVHAEAIRARGAWLPGAIDPAARGRGQKDGDQLLQNYIDLGLNLVPADNGVEAGLQDMWIALSAGKFRVFASCTNWFQEYRLYRRDEKGRIVKEKDHLMDSSRYLKRTGRDIAITEPRAREAQRRTNWRTA